MVTILNFYKIYITTKIDYQKLFLLRWPHFALPFSSFVKNPKRLRVVAKMFTPPDGKKSAQQFYERAGFGRPHPRSFQ